MTTNTETTMLFCQALSSCFDIIFVYARSLHFGRNSKRPLIGRWARTLFILVGILFQFLLESISWRCVNITFDYGRRVNYVTLHYPGAGGT